MYQSRLIITLASLITVAVTLVGCQGTGMETAATMKASLEQDIPAGTTGNIAASRLKARGFTVSADAKSAWGEWPHANYLSGHRSEGVVVQRIWNVSAMSDGNVVTGFEVTTGPLGL